MIMCGNRKLNFDSEIMKIARKQKGLTLLEMFIALAILVVVMAALLPQIASVNKGWDSRIHSSNALQNGRVLVAHINRNLTSATKIIAVSESTENAGYIEFQDNKGDIQRYEISPDYMVQFGNPGALKDLAGPIGKFNVKCYNDYDLDTPIDIAVGGVDGIRFVKTALILTNAAELGQDKNLTATAYLRVNYRTEDVITITSLEFNHEKTKAPHVAYISGNEYLCVYSGDSDDGFAVVFNIHPFLLDISRGVAFEFDAVKGNNPVLHKLDNQISRFLCLYSGNGDVGWAVVMKVDTGTWTVTNETALNYEISKAKTPALIHIKGEYYLCAYNGIDDDGWAMVLKVDQNTFAITRGASLEFDTKKGKTPSFAKIDDQHYLCAYQGDDDDGWAVVLKVDENTFQITKKTSFEFDSQKGKTPVLQKIDNEHYLCAYESDGSDGWAVILNVNKDTFAITKKTPYEFDDVRGKTVSVMKLNYLPPGTENRMDFLCGYSGDKDHGYVTILRVDTINWIISHGNALDYDSIDAEELMFEEGKAKTPALIEVNSTKVFCAYAGGPPKIKGVPIDEGHDKEHGFAVTFDVAPPLQP